MSALETAQTDVLALFADAGLTAVSDPRNLALPGAWITPSTITPATLAGSWRIEWEVYLVAPDNGDPIHHLGALLDAARQVAPELTARTLTLTLPNHSPDPLPALTFTIETSHT